MFLIYVWVWGHSHPTSGLVVSLKESTFWPFLLNNTITKNGNICPSSLLAGILSGLILHESSIDNHIFWKLRVHQLYYASKPAFHAPPHLSPLIFIMSPLPQCFLSPAVVELGACSR